MFGTSCTVNAPIDPISTLKFPAATTSPSAVWNDGQEIRAVPAAALPSALYTVPLMVVKLGPCASTVLESTNAISNATAGSGIPARIVETCASPATTGIVTPVMRRVTRYDHPRFVQ